MNAIRLGNPNLFVKGLVDQIYYDPTTGNIIGYDNVGSDGAIQTEVNLQEITGGFGNPVVGIIPDSTRMTGTYTSQAFSLQTRQLITGGKLTTGGTMPYCETVTAAEGKITATRPPVKHYAQPESDAKGWCYVKPKGAATYMGTNYGIDLSSGEVDYPNIVNGTQYEIYYFTTNASAEVLELPDMFNPSVVTISQKYGVFAKQNDQVSHGTLQGYLYVVIPRAVLNGNAGVGASQTENATTDGSWMALSPDQNTLTCETCGGSTKVFAYYIYVPCDKDSAITDIAVLGGGLSLKVGETKQVPVVYVMNDNSFQTPVYTDLAYESAATATATVTNAGVVEGKEVGNTEITVTYTTTSGTTYTAYCNVVVSAAD